MLLHESGRGGVERAPVFRSQLPHNQIEAVGVQLAGNDEAAAVKIAPVHAERLKRMPHAYTRLKQRGQELHIRKTGPVHQIGIGTGEILHNRRRFCK